MPADGWPISRRARAVRRPDRTGQPAAVRAARSGQVWRRLLAGAALLALGTIGLLFGLGFLVEGVQQPLQPSDAIIVISGDEDLARLRAGLLLWRERWAPRLILSGAAREGPISNAEAMRKVALEAGLPPTAILIEEAGADTYGNAVETRRLMESQRLRSGILVTSPYHLQRASLTFNSVFRDSGIRLIAAAAPDSDWRKQSWWQRDDLRRLTFREVEKLAYIGLTGHYN